MKSKNIDIQKYNSDILYKMIKVSKISYEMLNKEVLLDVILKAESNCKSKKLPSASAFLKSTRSKRKHAHIDDDNKNFKDFSTKRRSK